MKSNKLKKALAFLLVSSFALSNMQTYTAFAKTLQPQSTPPQTKVATQSENLQRKIIGYFPEWAYKSESQGFFNVTDLQWDSLTHIQYSFASVDPTTNKIALGNKSAALEETFNGMDLSYGGKTIALDPSLPYKGHFNLLQTMKKDHPNVDLLMSVGGWAGSRGFYTMMDTDQGIETFANSCVDFVRTYNFNGIDIDFEYPSATSFSGNPADKDLAEPRRATINARYNVMIKKLREKLDAASAQDNKPYLLSAAVTASSWVLGGVNSNEYAKYLDFLSVMSYDFHGGWNEYVENLANIYPDPNDTETVKNIMPMLNMDWAYKYYRGVLPPEKIIMGIPYYSRGWENVQGGNGTGLHGTSKTPASGKYNIWGDDLNGDDILEPAGANPLWHIMNLMDRDPKLKESWDDIGKVPHVWQPDEKIFLSFENTRSIDERVKYIKDKNLGGALIWVMNGDYGPNPNYVPGSTDVNKGKYTFGDTLTKSLSTGLKAIGNYTKTPDTSVNLPQIAVDVKMTGKYDHPNYTYNLDITNYTNAKIDGGWTVSFDLPKSASYTSSWGGSFTVKDNGDFKTITITSGGWQSLDAGAKVTLQGMIGLCFSDITNVTFNGMNPVGKNGGSVIPPTNTAPTISGATNQTIIVGDTFNSLTGVTATDKEDGVLTSSIKITGTVDTTKAGTYNLTYTVADSKGLTTTVTRVITVNAAPVNSAPTIIGATNQTILVGDTFNPLTGVTATDKEDGVLTSSIKVTGTVDTTRAGNYNLIYTVTDSKGLTTTVTRVITVNVVPNTAPTISGATNQTIKVGDTFNSLTGITATDKEDGVLTSSIKVTGTVDTTKAGTYNLTYTVADSKGLSITVTRVITVNAVIIGDTFNPTKIYVTGDKVIYNGVEYTAKYWTKGNTPDKSDAWARTTTTNTDGSKNFIPGTAYNGGDIVKYNNKNYKCNWWTTSVPGSDSSWTAL